MTATVLYIEDNDDNVVLVRRILNRRPHLDFVVARTGQTGLDLARRTRPALILLDRRLPDMSGDEVLTRITADDALAGTAVVVMLSGDIAEGHVAAARSAGAAGYLGKPFDVAELLAVVDRRFAPPPT